ncbi:MAG: hypothetical protein M3328_14190 [Chloroflexota bacterium]|nr:hypothetical protein [Chloroflexota bacterium]
MSTSMERNHDWKGPAALVMAALALFIALGGTNMFNFLSPGPPNTVVYINEGQPVPVHLIPFAGGSQALPTPPAVIPAAPVVPAVPDIAGGGFFDTHGPAGYTYSGRGWGYWDEWRGWFGQMPSIMPVLFALALVFIGWRLLSPGRNHPTHLPQAPTPPPYTNPGYNPSPGVGAPPPPGPLHHGDINQRQADS